MSFKRDPNPVSNVVAASAAVVPPRTPPPQFFVDHKRGEVNELRQLLRQVQSQRDNQKKRETIKKVIAYMTLGIDVSKLFGDMVMASCTTDVVQKKMIYLYLTNYAESNPDLAILAVNTLQKDCRDDDPTIRGLALRSLCSLRLSNMVEYLEPAIRKALSDVNGYVRRNAVIGCVKLFHVSPEVVLRTDLVGVLYKLLADGDTQVAANAIYALNEVLIGEGGLVLTKDIAAHLLNRIKYFTEWGQCAVLNLLSAYVPNSDDEMFDIMNILEDRLKHSSSAVVLGCTKCFVDLTQNKPDLHLQVLQRLKPPLLTLMSTSTPELSYTILLHIHLLVARADSRTISVMEDDYKLFFCRYNDPSYIKTVKLDILTLIATETNVQAILCEASEYVSDVDSEIAKKSIQAFGVIAMKIDAAADSIVEQLLSFLELDVEYVLTATVCVMKDILRKHPQHFTQVRSVMEKCAKRITEPSGMAAVIWMLGEFGESIDLAPYLLEPMVNSFSDHGSDIVRLELLTAAMKLFFKRPPEMQHILGRLLQKSVQECTHPDIHDRALFYLRLLTYSPQEANKILNCEKARVDVFLETVDREALDVIFAEFNTLAVVYGQPSSKFVAVKQIPFQGQSDDTRTRRRSDGDSGESGPVNRESTVSHGEGQRGVGEKSVELLKRSDNEGGNCPSPTFDLLNGNDSEDGLKNSGDLIGLLSTRVLSPKQAVEEEALRLGPETSEVDAAFFQQRWGSLSVHASLSQTYRAVEAPSVSQLEALCTASNLHTMASGAVDSPTGPMVKLYLHGQDQHRQYYFVELLVKTGEASIEVTVKCDGERTPQADRAQQIVEIVKTRLDSVLHLNHSC